MIDHKYSLFIIGYLTMIQRFVNTFRTPGFLFQFILSNFAMIQLFGKLFVLIND